METSVIKQNKFTEVSASSPVRGGEAGAALGGFSFSFTDLLHRAGVRLENGLNALSDRAGISRIGERRAAEPAREPREVANDDRGRERPEHVRSRDDGGTDRADARRRDRADAPERAPKERADQPAARRDDAPASTSKADSAAAPAPGDSGKDGKSTAADAAPGQAAAQDPNAGHGNAAAAQAGHAAEAAAGTAGAGGAQTQAAATSTAELVIAGLLAGMHVQAQAEGATQTDTPDAVATSEQGQRNEGLSTALAALAKQAGQGARNGAQHNAAAAGPAAEGESQTGDEAASALQSRNGLERKGQQAALLAAKVGQDTHLQVKVTASDEARVLMSRPQATLATVMAGDEGSGKMAAAQQPGQAASGAQAGQNALVQAQAAVAAVATGGQAQGGANGAGNGTFVQAIADAKGAGPAPVAATTGGNAAHAGGGEGGAQNGAGAGTGPQGTQQGQAAQAHATQAPRHAQFHRQVLEQVQVHVAKAMQSGADKITIQLKPAELGRIEVRMEVGQDGRTTVHVTADKQDTLDLLQKDARDLARSLQDAGLRADTGSLNFGLREQQAKGQDKGRSGANRALGAVETPAAEATQTDPAEGWSRRGRVDIRA